ncbi:EFR1 family ferrodoxin [Clostridium sp. MSJ-4]|uniref:EFR1 family ferrodoxin n=1 Tax=Clostridium simiarum TaxID=2841506 RepID=A0ABS6F1C9_9CLOT|nr:EFR1 family ferrodoxin [Clostridium simiarum]MBU5592195.1 EFR1 family ferrodoxin [Clostridium simiarum]
MKNIIYYFTGTGNSMMIAKEVANVLGNTEIRSLAKETKKENKEIDANKIGFVFPLYFSGVPEVVERFIKRTNFKADYFFSIVTRGGSPGFAVKQVSDLLEEKNLRLNYSVYIKMPSNYIRLYDMKDENINFKIIRRAQEEIKTTAHNIKNNKNNKVRDNILYYTLSKGFYKHWRKNLNTKDTNMHVDEKCTSCGLCMKICPVSNISMIDSKPMWNHKCQDCMACVQLCPVRAVQIGKKTIYRKRYKNPYVTLKEMIHSP